MGVYKIGGVKKGNLIIQKQCEEVWYSKPGEQDRPSCHVVALYEYGNKRVYPYLFFQSFYLTP